MLRAGNKFYSIAGNTKKPLNFGRLGWVISPVLWRMVGWQGKGGRKTRKKGKVVKNKGKLGGGEK